MDIVSRLIKFREYTGLTNSQFADLAKIPRPTLSQFLNGRNKRLSDELIGRLHNTYPNLNLMWLLFNEGNMLIDENIEFSKGKTDDTEGLLTDDFSELQLDITDDLQESDVEISAQSRSGAVNSAQNHAQGVAMSGFSQQSIPMVPSNSSKTIESIMVFYTDKSFDIFKPSGK